MLTRLLVGLLGRLPLGVLWKIADLLAWLCLRLFPSRRKLAEENVRRAFPELSAAKCRQIVKRAAQNAARTLLELFKLPRLSREVLRALLVEYDLQELREAYATGRGLIIVSAHYGNWELLAAVLAEEIGPLTVVAHGRERNPLGPTMSGARRQRNIVVLEAHETRAMLRVLREGGMLGLLADQRPRQGGLWLDFLGRPALTYAGPATLAALSGARMFACFCRRREDGRFELIGEEILLAHTGDRKSDVQENTRRVNAAIERAIRAAPENWLWLHHRWKGPKGEAQPAYAD